MPVPSIIFCPAYDFDIHVLNKSEIHRRNKNKLPYDNISSIDYRKIQVVDQIAFGGNRFINAKINESIFISKDEIESILIELSPKNFIGSCIIRNVFYQDCSIFFNRVLSGGKICFSFNQLPLDELFYSNVYTIEEKIENYKLNKIMNIFRSIPFQKSFKMQNVSSEPNYHWIQISEERNENNLKYPFRFGKVGDKFIIQFKTFIQDSFELNPSIMVI